MFLWLSGQVALQNLVESLVTRSEAVITAIPPTSLALDTYFWPYSVTATPNLDNGHGLSRHLYELGQGFFNHFKIITTKNSLTKSHAFLLVHSIYCSHSPFISIEETTRLRRRIVIFILQPEEWFWKFYFLKISLIVHFRNVWLLLHINYKWNIIFISNT